MPTARRRLESKDIPQADSLENVRRIIDAVADGSKTKADVSDRTGINPRHVLYGLHTARVLGFLVEEEGGGFGVTEVMAIESAIYSHPWTGGNFSDSLRAGYECRTLRLGAELIGYFVLMAAAGEAHLLNLSVAARHQPPELTR